MPMSKEDKLRNYSSKESTLSKAVMHALHQIDRKDFKLKSLIILLKNS